MQVEIPDNLDGYKIRSITSLSKRQVGYLFLGIAVFVLLTILIFTIIANRLIAAFCLIPAAVVAILVVLWGFVEFMGLSLGATIRRFFSTDVRRFERGNYKK